MKDKIVAGEIKHEWLTLVTSGKILQGFVDYL